jgi:formylglycine-generating enzyme required for sulfatase activity
MKKPALICVGLLAVSGIVWAQLPRLGILPISGVSRDDGENIARLLSNEPHIRSIFTVVIPQISTINGLDIAPEPAVWSIIDGELIGAVSKQLSLDFMMIGHIQTLRDRNVIIITLIKADRLQLIAGGYREFHALGDIRSLLPSLTAKIVEASKHDASKAPVLAAFPFTLPPAGISLQEAEVLLQFLMIELANTGRYAVLARTKTVKIALEILETMLTELPDIDTIRALSKSINAQCVLLGNVIHFEEQSGLFFAQILSLENVTLLAGAMVEYRNITDGFHLMPEIGFQLTGVNSGRTLDAMVWIAGGSFTRGSGGGKADEKPVSTVAVSSFYMAKTPVTQKQYEEVMGSNPSNYKGDDLPVENVSWYDAVEYCNKLSVKEGLIPAYSGSADRVVCNFSVNGYRLPTEAEWEYAAKGGNRDALSFEYAGGNNPDSLGWYTENSGNQTHEVGSKSPNSAGLYDMSGNVWEWCWDWYGPYQQEPSPDPCGPDAGEERVARGGSWDSASEQVRSSHRGHTNPRTRYKDLGFRVLRPIF